LSELLRIDLFDFDGVAVELQDLTPASFAWVFRQLE
jgi:hypothetical protein